MTPYELWSSGTTKRKAELRRLIVLDDESTRIDEDHPLWLVNEQIKDFTLRFGASDDARSVVAFFEDIGFPPVISELLLIAINEVFGPPVEDDEL